MIKYHTSRALADKFNVNLAKWKRWSREFLPPDPLGGMQSGFARQYHPDQAFTVLLGGHLVADLKFSIPDARRIIEELEGWIKTNGYHFNARGRSVHPAMGDLETGSCLIYILPAESGRFQYIVRQIRSKKKVKESDSWLTEEQYRETYLNCLKKQPVIEEYLNVRVLNLARLLIHFIRSMDISPQHYPGVTV